ncbi:UDP-N-acetylenolpyruvoylglucosamine reductase [Alkaliphilus metalliredigens QYMF]|uniref:UDP-N-acetylenolpyruvoylglucosamine reductase n=1 Tax=Alkaliphilus metalliredigens (strain QYMF) TaxID=293826 RepID=MURB_ALKMQ|nr:UDP-N-acetylmuramate dehydrogenase [Alkaliphilus metalliredigens]A6TVF6.1 RecName: Full=UDP-N-acetylenolpyruvoylglucosamine reductase; AltName: Full=UDP-N-acetylmuramate dehydrogenase [Alkaliphilus metalliredigens QYMF]ABR50174.1 UDP-N-acetylenolpyruvoylglucosamine reductase [Alkaliphilus metalliredigens QYMF]
MDKENLYQEFVALMGEEHVFLEEPMKKHTSFKIGGPADLLVMPRTVEEIRQSVEICKKSKTPYFVMGNGSNLLVRDKGMRCVVIKIAENFNEVRFEGNHVIVQTGILLSTLSNQIARACLKGFEFANGIPGTVGGAITMNAGAYGGEMKDVVKSCKVLNHQGEIIDLSLEELELDYRTSIIQEKGYIALEVVLALQEGKYEEIRSIIDDLTVKRTTKQPLHLPCAGSVFKRPPGYFAGKLIQDCNLKGFKIGGAQVSELHSGFIVNIDNASAADVLNLIAHIQKQVKEKFDVGLHNEVRVVGEV